MAEGVLFNVAEGIIGQLGNPALKEIGLIWGVKDELQKLKNTVTTIKAVLQDAEEHQALSNAIKDWVERLKDVFFEADDLLDDFFTEVLRREVMTRNKKAKEELSLSNYIGDGMELEWQGLRKLQYLSLYDHPKLASLPMGLQQATSLRHLTISNCPSLTTIPEWICNIISLQSLEILHCTNLTSLPVLTSLKKLEILDCPILAKGCKSEDWLAHIQNLKGDLAPPKEEESEQNESMKKHELKSQLFTKIFRHCSGSTSQ